MADPDFARSSILEILIPDDPNLDIEESLRSAAESDAEENESPSLWSSIAQRDLLFFDEHVPLFLLLKTPYEDESRLKDQIARLSIAIEAHAISSPTVTTPGERVASPPASQPSRDTIWSASLDTKEEPVSVIVGSDEDDDGRDIILIWKVAAFLSRPRIRLQAPAVTFKLSGTLTPPQSSANSDPPLPRGIPLPANLLEPLRFDPALQGQPPPYFSAARLSGPVGSSPTAAPPPSALPLHPAPRRPVRAIPAVSSRIRYYRPPRPARGKPEITATLDLDVPAFAPHPLELVSVELSLEDGLVDAIEQDVIGELPMRCHARDHVVFLYRLAPDNAMKPRERAQYLLEVRIRAAVLMSETCRPRIEVHWRTHVDFAHVLTAPAGPAIQRARRPPDLNRTSGDTATGTTTDSAANSRLALSIAITSLADGPLRIGEPFRWRVVAINHSATPRRLRFAVVPSPPQQHRRSGDVRRPPSSRPGSARKSAFGGVDVAGKDGRKDVAPAVVEEGALYAAVKAARDGQTDVVYLSADAQIGPLQPGACGESELEFMPLASGLLQVEAIRVTDGDTNENVDVQELPDIFVLERRENSPT